MTKESQQLHSTSHDDDDNHSINSDKEDTDVKDTHINESSTPITHIIYAIFHLICFVGALYYYFKYYTNGGTMASIGYFLLACCCSPCFFTYGFARHGTSNRRNNLRNNRNSFDLLVYVLIILTQYV